MVGFEKVRFTLPSGIATLQKKRTRSNLTVNIILDWDVSVVIVARLWINFTHRTKHSRMDQVKFVEDSL